MFELSSVSLQKHVCNISNTVLNAQCTPGSPTLQWSWARWWSSCQRSLLRGFSSTWSAATCASVTTLEPAKHCASVYLINWRMRPSQPAWRTTSLPSTGWRSCWRTLRRCRAKQQGSSSSSKVDSSLPSSIHLQKAWHSPRLWLRRYNLQDMHQPSIELWFNRPELCFIFAGVEIIWKESYPEEEQFQNVNFQNQGHCAA